MLIKPKFLTGEVKEFIDIGYLGYIDLVGQLNPVYLEVINFYNQPFDPAMIEKYFNGCEREKIDDRWISSEFICDEDNNPVTIDVYIRLEKIAIYSANFDWEFPIPETLSQFITFALSAGIKLEWRE